ncbi:MAG: N-acetylglucosamine-6-phosphate deacetylase [Anaerolineae bacterium]
MSTHYPWFDPPAHEQLVVRPAPGVVEEAVVLEWEGERLTGVRQAEQEERRQLPEDPSVFATAGLFDTQINGYLGRGFKDVDLGPEGIRDLCWSIALTGSTSFLPTVTTDALDTMRQAMANIDVACCAYPDVAAMVPGIHQEGPWISPVDGPRGAHALRYVQPPDYPAFQRLQAAAGGRIRLLTLAPEVEGAIDMIERVAGSGVVVALGHHQADGATIRRAVEAGARTVTHLGNGCNTTMPRHPNLLWQQAAEDRLYAGIIADGQHLPAETVKVLYRAKPADRLILVSDAISMAGAPPGLYRARDAIAELTADGRFGFYQSPLLMGAVVPLARCLANLAAFVEEGQTPAAYVDRATSVPATLFGLSEAAAGMAPGAWATFVVWRWHREVPDLIPQRIVIRGRTVYDVDSLPVGVPFGRVLPRAEPDMTHLGA